MYLSRSIVLNNSLLLDYLILITVISLHIYLFSTHYFETNP